MISGDIGQNYNKSFSVLFIHQILALDVFFFFFSSQFGGTNGLNQPFVVNLHFYSVYGTRGKCDHILRDLPLL